MDFLHREQIKTFHFTRCFFDETTKTAHLFYAYNDGALQFEEKICFNDAPDITDASKRRAVEQCLRLLHLAAGISYYKLYAPDEIKVDCSELTKAEADFFNLFYIDLCHIVFRRLVDIWKFFWNSCSVFSCPVCIHFVAHESF